MMRAANWVILRTNRALSVEPIVPGDEIGYIAGTTAVLIAFRRPTRSTGAAI
jgi:hypothetical protein